MLVDVPHAAEDVYEGDVCITDIIADNARGGYFVLGHRHRSLREIDLASCRMEMTQDGELISEGTGVSCAGSPLNALRWLAGEMVHAGHPLKAGDVIISGALGPTIRAKRGSEFKGYVEGLGSASGSFLQL